jgi:putative endonuclease
MKIYYVYILKSLTNGRFYIGQTNNIERRLRDHNSGQSRYTSLTKPFILLHTEEFSTRAEAVRRERNLKSGKGREWIRENFGSAIA